MGTFLRIFVCAFSFLFTGYFVALLLSILFAPISWALMSKGHIVWGTMTGLIPLLLGCKAGIPSAREALRLENERQQRRRARREQRALANRISAQTP